MMDFLTRRSLLVRARAVGLGALVAPLVARFSTPTAAMEEDYPPMVAVQGETGPSLDMLATKVHPQMGAIFERMRTVLTSGYLVRYDGSVTVKVDDGVMAKVLSMWTATEDDYGVMLQEGYYTWVPTMEKALERMQEQKEALRASMGI